MAATTKAALLVAAGPAAVAGAIPAGVAALTKGVLKTMFLAKVKSVTVVLFGTAVLGMGTGGVWYQTRVAAADSASFGSQERVTLTSPKESARTRALEDEQSVAEVARALLEEAKLNEAKLKADLKTKDEKIVQLRNQLEMLQIKFESQLNQDEKILRDANERMKLAQKQEMDARQLAEKERYATNVNQAKALKEGNKQAGPPNSELLQLNQMEEELQRKVEQHKLDLMKQLKELEEMQRQELAKIQLKRASFTNEAAAKKAKPPQEGGDKLDQILQRLEKLEKRIDGLDKGK
jgi:hypothetical protein